MFVKDKNIILAHFPRTGGGTIESVFGQPVGVTEPPHRMRLYISDNDWNSCYKVGLVRNPYDRLVSEFLYFGSDDRVKHTNYVLPGESFPDFVLRLEQRCALKNAKPVQMKDWYVGADGSTMDQIIRYENYQQEVPLLLALFGYTDPLPHVNRSDGRLPYTAYYDNETRHRVADLYAVDLEYWGYEF